VKLTNCGSIIVSKSPGKATNQAYSPKQLFGNELQRQEVTRIGLAFFFAIVAIFRLHFGTMHIKLCSGIRRLK
jgi:hypothetical protein